MPCNGFEMTQKQFVVAMLPFSRKNLNRYHAAVDISCKPVIGLAGGIGAGKSSVAKILANLGCVISDSDADARHALVEPHIRQTIVEWWGNSVLDRSGEIDRKKVAEIIFSDQKARKRLESLIHPWIELQRRERFAHASPEVPALVIDAPLLFEAGLERECDAVIYVDAAPEIRLSRVMATRGWTAEELASRERFQLPLDQKRKRADHVVENNGDLAALKAQVSRILATIVASCRKSHRV
jgi:dephospho-CoA kinase